MKMDSGTNYKRYLKQSKPRKEKQEAINKQGTESPAIPASEKQGHLGQLEAKSRSELKDLLARQEKLLANKDFIRKLPDKGARIKQLAEKLQELLKKPEQDINNASELLDRLTIDAENKSRLRSALPVPMVTSDNEDILADIINKDHLSEKHIKDDREINSPLQFYNSYENVIRKVENTDAKKTFVPSKSINAPGIHSLNSEQIDRLKPDIPGAGNVKQTNVNRTPRITRPRYGYDDCLVMDIHGGVNEKKPAQFISMDESVTLIKEQKKLHKEVVAQHAADRLAERLHIKVGSFNPEGASASSTVYRDTTRKDNSDIDDDDDKSETEIDYPD